MAVVPASRAVAQAGLWLRSDRGFAYAQVKYPENFFLLRGNHECASINRIYGFYDECKRRYNIRLWKTFTDCFNCLPVAALVDEKVRPPGCAPVLLLGCCLWAGLAPRFAGFLHQGPSATLPGMLNMCREC